MFFLLKGGGDGSRHLYLAVAVLVILVLTGDKAALAKYFIYEVFGH